MKTMTNKYPIFFSFFIGKLHMHPMSLKPMTLGGGGASKARTQWH